MKVIHTSSCGIKQDDLEVSQENVCLELSLKEATLLHAICNVICGSPDNEDYPQFSYVEDALEVANNIELVLDNVVNKTVSANSVWLLEQYLQETDYK